MDEAKEEAVRTIIEFVKSPDMFQVSKDLTELKWYLPTLMYLESNLFFYFFVFWIMDIPFFSVVILRISLFSIIVYIFLNVVTYAMLSIFVCYV